MSETTDRPKLQWLHEEECLTLLAGDVIGRLAVVQGATPLIVPVNYVLDGRNIVFRTDEGTKLGAGPRARASFEVDAFDRERRIGWSVVATGRLEEVTHYQSATWERLQALPVEPWAAGPKAHWMQLLPSHITGRRVG